MISTTEPSEHAPAAARPLADVCLLTAGALFTVGCGAGLGLRMEIFEPAVIPAHVFPRVFVRGDDGPDAEALAQAVVSELEARGLDAVELPPAASARAQLSGDEGPALLVVVTVARSSTTEARHYTEMPSLCAPACSSVPVERLHDVVVLHARAELTMSDARTEEPFAVERFERREDELDMGAGGRLMARLQAAALELFRASRSTREVDLMPLASAAGRAALEDARAGRIGAAVIALRALAERTGDRSVEERVAIHYDLGQTLRVAALDGDAALDTEARAALEEAMHLRPEARIGQALEALAEEVALRARVREEDLAYRRNRGELVPPAAPRGYE